VLPTVPVKSVEQQAGLVAHRVRDVLVRQQTMLTNALRAHLAEFGVVEPRGQDGLGKLIEAVEAAGAGPPAAAREALLSLVRQIASLAEEVAALDRRLRAAAREDEVARRLQTVRGIGPVGASALVATVADARAFGSGREFAAWLGLAPRQNSTGQGSSGRDQQARGPLPAAPAGERRTGRAAALKGGARGSLARQVADAEAAAEGGGRLGEQDRTGRLGGHGARRNLSAAGGGGSGMIRPRPG